MVKGLEAIVRHVLTDRYILDVTAWGWTLM